MYLHHSYSYLPYPAEAPHLVWTYSSYFFAVNMKSTASNLLCLSLSLTLSTRNSACRTRMGSSCACAVGPGMMLAVGELSHGNAKKKKKPCRCAPWVCIKRRLATPTGHIRYVTVVSTSVYSNCCLYEDISFLLLNAMFLSSSSTQFFPSESIFVVFIQS